MTFGMRGIVIAGQIINGEAGEDTLPGTAGNDIINGGYGNDRLIFSQKIQQLDLQNNCH